MTSRPFLGVDLGTTYSRLACVLDDAATGAPVTATPIEFPSQETGSVHSFPMLVTPDLNSPWPTGVRPARELLESFQRDTRTGPLLRQGLDFFDSAKADFTSLGLYSPWSPPTLRSPEGAAGAVLARLLLRARRVLPQFPLGLAPVTVTVPSWLDAPARRLTKRAAAIAGFRTDQIDLIDEPIAAFLHCLNDPEYMRSFRPDRRQNLLVLGCGGGTVDVALVRVVEDSGSPMGRRVEVLAVAGSPRGGGRALDRAVMDEVLWSQVVEKIGVHRAALPVPTRRLVEETLTPTVARVLKERVCKLVSVALDAGLSWPDVQALALDASFFLRRKFACRGFAKKLTGRFCLKAQDLERITQGQLYGRADERKRVWGPGPILLALYEVLKRGNVEPAKVHGLILHGGACRNPWVRRFLNEELVWALPFRADLVVREVPDLDTSAACGAALACCWRHGRRRELASPVIASHGGVLARGDRPVPFMRRWSPRLPFPAKEGSFALTVLHLPRSDMRWVLLPLYGKPWPLDSMVLVTGVRAVNLPPGLRAGTRVLLEYFVDRDKIAHWRPIIDGVEPGPWRDEDIFNLPPASRQAWELRQLRVELRRRHDQLLSRAERFLDDQGGEVEWAFRFYRLTLDCQRVGWREEAMLLILLGDLDEAEIRIGEMGHLPWCRHEAANLLAAVYARRGDRERELEWAALARNREADRGAARRPVWRWRKRAKSEPEEITRLRAQIALGEDVCSAREQLGDVLGAAGDERGARAQYAEAARVAERQALRASGDRSAWLELSRLRRKADDRRAALFARWRAWILRYDVFGERGGLPIIA